MKSIPSVSSKTISHRTTIFLRAQNPELTTHLISTLFALLIFLSYSNVQAATLPQGFVETQVADGLANPVAMEFAPDGRLLVSEQVGTVRIIKNGVLLSTPFLDLTNQVDSTGERGVFGIAFDPNFSSNHYVYIYYTAKTPASHNRVSRFTANGDVAIAGSEVVIFEMDNLGASTFHNGGAIHFGVDGKLYVATGEANISSNADSFENLLGKILRINSDGSIPSDNPFYNTASGNNRAIWALGLRNPYTFAVQPGTGRIFINDVGENTWEEINDGIAGSHYGWPNVEGPSNNPNYRSPLLAYQHGTGEAQGCAITGGTFYNPSTAQFPDAYNGSYFFADYCGGWIRRYYPATNIATDFASSISSPVDLKVGPDGSLYYLARGSSGQSGDFRSNTGVIYKVTYTASQQPTGEAVYLSDLPWGLTVNGWGPIERDQSNGEEASGDGHTITLNGTTYAKGVGAHAFSQLQLYLGNNYTNFLADIGVDDEVGSNGSVTFEVWADNVKLYDSGLMTGASATKSINVDVTGFQSLLLVVNNGGDDINADHADWAGARLLKYTGQPPTITQQPVSQTVAPTTSATFTVAATGTSPIIYQWERNGVTITGASSSRYTIPSVSLSDNGARFRVVATNAYGSATSNEATLTVSANQAPTATILTPQAGSFYSGGETINFSGTGTDPEDGQLPASAFTWEVVFYHDTHTHPFINPFSGVKSGSFQIPTVGETATNVWYRIYLTVTDSSGATNTTFRDILPRKSLISFATNPGGLLITLDGQPRTTPTTIESVVGIQRTIGVISPQSVAGAPWGFSGWSDGGAISHTIAASINSTSYTATFAPPATPTPTPTPVPTPTPGQSVLFTDDFNDNTRDTNKWSLGLVSKAASAFDSQVLVAERNQRLEIVPRSNLSGNHFNGYVSAALWDLTGGDASVEVVQAANAGADTIFAIGIDAANCYRFVVEDGRLYFQQTKEPFDISKSVPYSPTAHRFWRFRHSAPTNQIIFETSPDGLNWNVMRSMDRDMSISALRVELSGGTFSPIISPGTAIFDNFRLQTFHSNPSTSTTVGFVVNEYVTHEFIGSEAVIPVNRVGDTTTAFTVDYSTSDTAGLTPCQTNGSGSASERCDYTTTAGTLRFAPGETTKTIRIPIIDDAYIEPNETFTLTLRNPQGANLNFFSATTIVIGGTEFEDHNDVPNPANNPIDLQDFFIFQQYADFLGRMPDPSGYQFWNNRMTNCQPGQICDRIDTSQRFFQSDEFQERGFYVYRLYDALLGRLPLYREFMPDVGSLSGLQTVQEQRQSKDAYLLAFINKSEFKNLYGQYLTSDGSRAIDAAGFVNALSARAGITPASKQTLINNLLSGARTPAQTLEDFILTPEMSGVGTKFYDRGFITMQYFGYLRRDPDTTGFNFWVGQLIGPNAPHRQDYRFMVGGFLNSDEYRFRFALIPAKR